MSVTEIKEQLHLVIDTIEDEAFLDALLTIINCQQLKIDNQASDEEIRIIEEREVRYRNGESKTFPWKDVQAEIKKKYGF